VAQKAELLRLMRLGRILTRINAWKLVGCTKLSARIRELRKEGHQIETFYIGDEHVTIAMYRLKPMTTEPERAALIEAAAQASQLTEDAKRIELHNTVEQLGSIARSVPALLIARGVAKRELTHAQAMAGLEAAEEALRFIRDMEINVNGKIITESISRWEARAGLAKVLKAIDRKSVV